MSNQEFENYLLLIGKLLQLNRDQCDQISGELRDHLEMRVADLTADGLEHADAVRVAIEEFGDAAAMAKNFQSVMNLRRRRWMMRFMTFSVAGCFLAAVLAMALWPEESRYGGPAAMQAQEEKPDQDPFDHADQGDPFAGQPTPQLVHKISDHSARTASAELALKELGDFAYDQESCWDVIADLKHKTGLPIVLDPSAEELALDTLISFEMRVPLNQGLKLMLDPHNATYVIQGGVVRIISLDEASDPKWMRTKMFDCGDLLKVLPKTTPKLSLERVRQAGGGGGLFSIASYRGQTPIPQNEKPTDTDRDEAKPVDPLASLEPMIREQVQAYLVANYPTPEPSAEATLLNLIFDMVDQESWEDSGIGLARASCVNGLLVVHQTEENLLKIENLIDDLKGNLRLRKN